MSTCEGRYPAPIWAGILSFTTFFADIAIAGTLLPFFIDDVLGLPREWVGITITVQYACATVGLFSTGVLADYIGLRKTLIIVSAANVVLLNIFGWVRSAPMMILVRGGLGFVNSYALGLSWVSKIAPRARLARWLSAAVCIAQASILIAGLIAGALRGAQMHVAMGIVSIPPAIVALYLLGAREAVAAPPPAPPASAAPAATADATAAADTVAANEKSQEEAVEQTPAPPPAAPPRARDGLARLVRTRYFWAVAFAPFVQGGYMGAIFQTLAPLVLKTVHSWPESDVARMFQIGGLVALIAHATATPWFSSKPWRHRAVQVISLVNAALLVIYGLLGADHAAAALAIPVICFVGTAICLGIVNFMVANLARTIAPEALAACTGATRCLFTFGYAVLPAAFVAMLNAGSLIAPCLCVAVLFVIKALLMQMAAKLPSTPAQAAPAQPAKPAEDDTATSAAAATAVEVAEVKDVALKVSQ